VTARNGRHAVTRPSQRLPPLTHTPRTASPFWLSVLLPRPRPRCTVRLLAIKIDYRPETHRTPPSVSAAPRQTCPTGWPGVKRGGGTRSWARPSNPLTSHPMGSSSDDPRPRRRRRRPRRRPTSHCPASCVRRTAWMMPWCPPARPSWHDRPGTRTRRAGTYGPKGGGDHGIANIMWDRKGISVGASHDPSHSLHPHPYPTACRDTVHISPLGSFWCHPPHDVKAMAAFVATPRCEPVSISQSIQRCVRGAIANLGSQSWWSISRVTQHGGLLAAQWREVLQHLLNCIRISAGLTKRRANSSHYSRVWIHHTHWCVPGMVRPARCRSCATRPHAPRSTRPEPAPPA
jgi:hypothetical protein